MRTDVKIGIAVGLVVVVGVVIYLVINPGSPDPTEVMPAGGASALPGGSVADDGDAMGAGSPEPSVDKSLFGADPSKKKWAPGAGAEDDTPGAGEAVGVAGIGDAGTDAPEAIAPGTEVTGAGAGETITLNLGDGTAPAGESAVVPEPNPDPGSIEITMVPSGPIDDAPAGTSFTPAIGDSSSGPLPDPGSTSVVELPYPDPTAGSTTPLVGAAKTHVIKSDDKLWTLAETYYGHGKHWQIIVSANPGLSPTALVVGKTIKIPPLPTEASPAMATPGSAAGTHGSITESLDGVKTYTVAKGDNFWKIAARSDVYGNGAHHNLIATANPGVSSTSLQPGNKLKIPPLPTSAVGGAISSTPPITPDPVTATGEKVYIVRQGDNGMWGISKSQYGDGKYYPAISHRNQGVNPSRLKVGQKLIIPSLEQAKAFIGGATRPTGGGSSSSPTPARSPRRAPAPSRSDLPDFS